MNGKWLTDVQLFRTRARATWTDIDLMRQRGEIIDCECGFEMVAGIDHVCVSRNRPEQKERS
jgi:hypothetical protein